MRKIYFSFLVFVLLFSAYSYSKSFEIYNVSNPSQTYFIVNGQTGYVGIGTNTPGYPLDVVGNARISSNLYVNGRLGVGTTSPTTKTTIENAFFIGSYSTWFTLRATGTGKYLGLGYDNTNDYGFIRSWELGVGDKKLLIEGSPVQIKGNLQPSSGGIYDLGSSSLQWRNIYASNIYQNGNQVLDTSTTFNGDVSGTYNNLQLGAGVVGTNELADNAVTMAKISQVSCPSGQALVSIGGGSYSCIDINPSDQVTGSGTTNYIPVWTGTNTLGNSVIYENGGNIGIGTTSPGAKLDVSGRLIADYIDASSKESGVPAMSQSALSAWVAMTSCTVTYGTVEKNTRIYKNGELIVSASGPSTGTFSVNAGDIITTNNKPVGLVASGNHHCIAPLVLAGTEHGFYSNRNDPHTVYIYSPFGTAYVEYYRDGYPGQDTPVANITVEQGQIATIVTTSTAGNYHHRFYSTAPVVITKTGSGGDKDIIPPASREILIWASATGASAMESGSSWNNVDGVYYYSEDGVGYAVRIADGSGSDMDEGLPWKATGDTYIIPHTITGYTIVALEPTTVRVYYWNSTSSHWELYKEHDLTSASRTNPGVVKEGEQAGNGAQIISNTPILVTGDRPFYFRTNDPNDDEYAALGYRSGERLLFDDNDNWAESGNDIYYNAGNVGIGTASPSYKLDVSGDIRATGDIVCTNCISLGSETTGNYVAGITAGTGISVSGTPGEGWSPTISVKFGSTSGTAAEGNKQITISAGSGLTGGGTVTIGAGGSVTLSHADTSSQSSVDNSGGTVIQDVTLDNYGHVTGINSVNLDNRYYTKTNADTRFANVDQDETITGSWTFNEDVKFMKNIYVAGNISYVNSNTLNVNGSIIPPLDDWFDIGASDKRWRNGYFSNSLRVGDAIVTSETSLQAGRDAVLRTVQGGVWSEIRAMDGDATNRPGVSMRTSFNGGSSWTEIARIRDDWAKFKGNVLPMTDNSVDIGSSSLRWRDAYFAGTVHAASFDGSISASNVEDVWVNENGDTMSGALTINAGAGELRLKPGSADHVYIEFYADSDNPNTRSGWMGYGSSGTNILRIKNELGSVISLDNSVTVSGDLTVNGGNIDMVKGQTSQIHSLGQISFDWTTSGTYDNPQYHGIQSKDENGNWADDLRINSYSNIILTIDSNSNDANSKLVIQKESATNGPDLFTIDETGKTYIAGSVGIGTTNPGEKLEVNGNIKLSGANPYVDLGGVKVRKVGSNIIISDV